MALSGPSASIGESSRGISPLTVDHLAHRKQRTPLALARISHHPTEQSGERTKASPTLKKRERGLRGEARGEKGSAFRTQSRAHLEWSRRNRNRAENVYCHQLQ